MKVSIATCALFLLVAGCGEDPPVVPPTDVSDVAADTSVDSGPNQNDGAGADTSTAVDGAITRNPACGKFDDGKHGQKIPWDGFASGATKLTCNSCRGGYPNIVGKWRYVDGKTEDPRVPLKSTDGTPYAETLEFDGNTWTNTIAGVDLGKPVTATISGWFFCSDVAELAGAPGVFVQQTVAPEGAFGNKSDTAWRADILTNGTDRILLGDVGFDSLTKAGTADLPYCRIGSVVDVEGTKVPCTDPMK